MSLSKNPARYEPPIFRRLRKIWGGEVHQPSPDLASVKIPVMHYSNIFALVFLSSHLNSMFWGSAVWDGNFLCEAAETPQLWGHLGGTVRTVALGVLQRECK